MSENPYNNQDPANPYGVPPVDPTAQQPSSQPYGESAYGQSYADPRQFANSSDPSAQQVPPAGQNPYGQPPVGQAPYGQPQGVPYAQAPYGQPGYGVAAPQGGWSDKSKLAAGLLGIFLGALGVHNFYLGNTGKAVAQLAITVLSLGTLSWISAIWGLIEGIMILAAAPGTQWSLDREGKPLRPSNV